jgi:hypothetical protein
MLIVFSVRFVVFSVMNKSDRQYNKPD